MTKFIFAITAAALSTSAIMLSPAAYATETRLSWADLDLGTDAGQHELARRTRVAIRNACPEQELTGTRIQDASVRACRASARAQIAQAIGGNSRVALSN